MQVPCSIARTSVVLTLLASQAFATDTTPPQFLTTPILHPAPVRAAPLTATITYTTDEPAQAELGFRTAEKTWSVIAESGYSTVHTTMVLGMHPLTQHEIRLRVRDVAGNVAEYPVRFHYTTPPLPSGFPPLSVTVSNPSGMEAGLTLVPARFSSSMSPASGTFIILLDAEGQVVWYYSTRAGLRDASRLRNGNILCLNTSRDAFEIDPLGNIVQRWWASNLGTAGAPAGSTLVAVDTLHHELSQLPLGETADFIGLSSSYRSYPNYPNNEVDPTITIPVGHVAGDVIVEFRRDGSIVRSFDVIDALDPYRICYNSLAPIYTGFYPTSVTDWGHSNAVMVDPSDDTWIVSLRNQETIVKIRRADHSVVWIHSTPERWVAPWSNLLLQPIGQPFEWHFHQHWPQLDANGRLSVFDNGNYRVVPPAPATPSSQWHSRGVAYEIDPVARTTRQVWSFEGIAPFLSGSLGGCLPQAVTGNYLLTEGNMPAPMNHSFSRVQEVTGTMPGSLQFEVYVNDPTGPAPSPWNWNVYRARRVSSVYPNL